MGSIFAQMGSLFAQISTPNPRPLLCRHTPLSGICTPVYIKRPPAHVGECWPKPEFTLSKTLGGSQMVVLRFTTLSARDRHWRNPRRKNYREHSNIKSVCVSALGSVQHMAQALQSSALIRNRTHVTELSATSWTTKPLIRINCWKKPVYDSSYFATCNRFFCLQDCRTRPFQVEYQGRTPNTRILERKPLIITSYRIRHRLELFHFAQFLLNAHCSST